MELPIPTSKKFNVGCGPYHLKEGWTNIDIRPFDGVDLVFDVTNAWPCSNDLEFVYGEHFIEHLSVDAAFLFLDNVYSSLLKGGIVRLSTPSLEWVLSTHFSLSNFSSSEIISQTIGLNRAFYGWGHRFLYSRKMLEAILLSCGFSTVCFCDYGKSSRLALCELEQHPGYTVIDNTFGSFPSVWIVEAEKIEDIPVIDVNLRNAVIKDFLSHVESGH